MGILASCILLPSELTSHTLGGDGMNILEEFWYGNIEPAECDTSSGKEYKELLRLISRNEDKLLATMTDEQKYLKVVVEDDLGVEVELDQRSEGFQYAT